MTRFTITFVIAAIAAVAFGLGGCSNIEYHTFRMPDWSDKLKLPSMSAPVVVEATKPITAEELLNRLVALNRSQPDWRKEPAKIDAHSGPVGIANFWVSGTDLPRQIEIVI